MAASGTKRTGALGEAAALAYLERLGYRVVDTNVRFGARSGLVGELDIVAFDGSVLAFVEIKTRRLVPGRGSNPAENVTPSKQRQLARLALAYAARAGFLDTDDGPPLRFDVVAVYLAPGDSETVLRCDLLRAAFSADSDGA
jgi:putative endonuclease